MTVTRKQLVEAQALTATVATVYTVPDLMNCQLSAFSALNNTASAVLLTVHVVESGGSVAAANKVISKTIGAGESYLCPELSGQVLPAGTTIRASGLDINLIGSGVEFTT